MTSGDLRTEAFVNFHLSRRSSTRGPSQQIQINSTERTYSYYSYSQNAASLPYPLCQNLTNYVNLLMLPYAVVVPLDNPGPLSMMKQMAMATLTMMPEQMVAGCLSPSQISTVRSSNDEWRPPELLSFVV